MEKEIGIIGGQLFNGVITGAGSLRPSSADDTHHADHANHADHPNNPNNTHHTHHTHHTHRTGDGAGFSGQDGGKAPIWWVA